MVGGRVVSRTEAPRSGTLPAALAELLLELAIGLHRYGIYPSDHPTVLALGDRLARRINAHTQREGPVTVGIADTRLVVADAASDPGQPILRDFARKIKDRGVGGFTLLPHLGAVDIELFLQALAEEPEDDLMPNVASERIRLHPPGYEKLQLSELELAQGDRSGRANDLWLGLARSAISNGAIEQGDATDIAGIADSVRRRLREEGGGRLMLGYLAQIAGVLAEEGAEGSGAGMAAVRSQLTALIDALDADTLRELVHKGGGNDANIRLAFDVCRSLDPATAVKVLEAIPKQEGRRISHQLVRLLRKMSARKHEAPASRQQHAVDTFRDAVERLSGEWHGDAVDADFADPGALDVVDGGEEAMSTEMRLLWISLEVGAVGASLEAAVRTLCDSEELDAVLDLLRATPEGHPVGDFVREALYSEETVARMVRAGTMDPELVDAVVEGAGLMAVQPLIDALIESPSRAVRRRSFDRLSKLGTAAGLAAVTRLEGQPWYVLRNLLVLSQCLDHVPGGVDPLPLMFHEDARVRKEAFPVCLKVADGRTPTLKAALDDDDERIVQLALREVQGDLPGLLVPDVVPHLEESPEMASLAIRALSGSSSPLALKALLDICRGRRLLGGARLSRKSPALLQALESLRERWGGVDEVRDVLAQAAESKDPEIRAAAGVGT